MPTNLDKSLIRDSGLTRNGNPVFVVLLPSEDGGQIAFKEKGKHGQGTSISLKKVMGIAFGDEEDGSSEAVVEKLRDKKSPSVSATEGSEDLVDLSSLESRLMIDGEPVMTAEVKSRLFEIVREIREERREELGLEPIQRGTKARKKRENTEKRSGE
jgi:hypothetical protein